VWQPEALEMTAALITDGEACLRYSGKERHWWMHIVNEEAEAGNS
jgi:hypothetical protein